MIKDDIKIELDHFVVNVVIPERELSRIPLEKLLQRFSNSDVYKFLIDIINDDEESVSYLEVTPECLRRILSEVKV